MNAENAEAVASAMFRAYTSGYDDPRPMHYAHLAAEFGVDGPPELDMVADAFDLGCRHGENDVEQFSEQELLEEMAAWGDA